MAKINVLDKHTAELIAAGEVVERPSSAVKELIENSIDSGASAVTVEIKNGGSSFIRVSDNGSGIERDDIRNAFKRHATSKIKTSDDLDAIMTLGFRGEALASICAVAKVELITKTADDPIGAKYEIEGGEETYFDDAGGAQGTTIIVRDLFFNTPARRKFLKKDVSETNAVAAVIERVALSHPEVSFKFIKDGKQAILTPGDGKLSSAVYAVLGKDFASTLLPADYTLDGIRVSGFVTKPELSRKNANMQYFFLNGRFIKTKTGAAALKQAYKNEIMTDRCPGCVLNIEMPYSQADVNVHPSKIEVRFSDESRVFHAVYYAVKSALAADKTNVAFGKTREDDRELLRPVEPKFVQLDMRSAPPVTPPKFEQKHTISGENNIRPTFSRMTVADIGLPENNEIKISKEMMDSVRRLDIFPSAEVKGEESVSAPADPQPISEQSQPPKNLVEAEYKLIGEAFMTYIIVESEGKLLFIDKHAAHERILFEQLTAKAHEFSQQLLVPVEVELNSDEYEAVLEHTDDFQKLGFEIEDSGMKSVLVRSVPMSLENRDVKDVILESAGKLVRGMTDLTPEFIDWLYHSMSCRAAIKGGEHTDPSFLDTIVRKVLNDDNIKRCPHGRPIIVEMTADEIKRRFGRT